MQSPATPRATIMLDRIISRIALTCQFSVLILVLVTVFDVVTRRFFVLGSVALQEAEWHLHAIFFLTALGYTYLRGAHVRIDIFSGRFSSRLRIQIEVVGFFLFMAPLSLLILFTGIDYANIAYETGEVSGASGGLPFRFLIKSVLPLGALLLFLAALARLIGNIAALRHGAEHEAAALLLTGEPMQRPHEET